MKPSALAVQQHPQVFHLPQQRQVLLLLLLVHLEAASRGPWLEMRWGLNCLPPLSLAAQPPCLNPEPQLPGLDCFWAQELVVLWQLLERV